MLLHPEDLPEGEDESSLVDVRVGNPFQLFDGPNQRELRDLHAELCRRAQLDVPNASFWAAMRRLCEACEEEREGKGNAGAADSMAVKEVAQMFAGQSATELDGLRRRSGRSSRRRTRGMPTIGVRSQGLGLARARAIVQESFEQMQAAKERIQQRVGTSKGGGGGGEREHWRRRGCGEWWRWRWWRGPTVVRPSCLPRTRMERMRELPWAMVSLLRRMLLRPRRHPHSLDGTARLSLQRSVIW